MPKTGKKTARKRILWTAADVKHLRKSARKEPVAKIARQLRRARSRGALQSHGIEDLAGIEAPLTRL